MKKQYLVPETEVLWLTSGSSILSASNGQNMTSATYGNRNVDSDDSNGFWD